MWSGFCVQESKCFFLIFKINLLAARNERESVQIAIRPKVSWSSSGIAGLVQVQCNDLCSTSGDRLVAQKHNFLTQPNEFLLWLIILLILALGRLVVGQSLSLRRVVPILGVPDALVPLDLPVSQINLLPG